jgi:hypothetical protein
MTMCSLGELIVQCSEMCSEICLRSTACQQKRKHIKIIFLTYYSKFYIRCWEYCDISRNMFSSLIIKVGHSLYLKNTITRNVTELNTHLNITAKLRIIFYASYPSERGLTSQGTRVHKVKNTCCKKMHLNQMIVPIVVQFVSRLEASCSSTGEIMQGYAGVGSCWVLGTWYNTMPVQRRRCPTVVCGQFSRCHRTV